MTKLPRFALFVFDALRRDMIITEHMPNLRRFIDEGRGFPFSGCVSPPTVFAGSAGCCGAIRGAGAEPQRIAALAHWRNEQRWGADVFTPHGAHRSGPGRG